MSELNWRHYPVICLLGLTRSTKPLGGKSRSADCDLNAGPPEFERLTSLCSAAEDESNRCNKFGISVTVWLNWCNGITTDVENGLLYTSRLDD